MALLLEAIHFAVERHAPFQRAFLNEPYALHVLRVAQGALASGLSFDAVVAAVLHDVMEDTAATPADLAELGCSPRTVMLVQLLTKPKPPDQAPPPDEAAYYAAIGEDHDALCLKLLDRADNLSDLRRALTGSWDRSVKKVEETERDFRGLCDACHNQEVQARFNAALTALREAVAHGRPKE